MVGTMSKDFDDRDFFEGIRRRAAMQDEEWEKDYQWIMRIFRIYTMAIACGFFPGDALQLALMRVGIPDWKDDERS